MLDQDLLTLLTDPEGYKTKIAELKKLIADSENLRMETELKLNDLFVSRKQLEKDSTNLSKLQYIFKDERAKVEEDRASVIELSKQIEEWKSTFSAKENDIERRIRDLKQKEEDYKKKELESQVLHDQALTIKDKFIHKLNRIKELANDA